MKLFLLSVSAFYFLVVNFISASNLEFYESNNDKQQFLAVLIPGFNVKPQILMPLMQEFNEQGIPGYLFYFSGTKKNQDKSLMTYENWLNDINTSLNELLLNAKTNNRKLLIIAHSMGGLYTLNFLNNDSIDKNIIYTVLLAPADALKSIKNIAIEKMPVLSFFIQNLPEDNSQLIAMLKDGLNIMGMQLNTSMIETIALGKHICGDNAASDYLTFAAFEGLILPTKNFSYPKNCLGCVYFHENDGLMNANTYLKYKDSLPDFSINNLGQADNEITAHTFEHILYDQNKLQELIKSIIDNANKSFENKTIEILSDLDLD